MTTDRVRRVLLGCALSNALIAGVGLVAATAPATITTATASPSHASVLETPARPIETTAAPTTAVTIAPAAAPITTKQIASTTTRKKSPSTTPAVAVDDTSGIVSSAAPPVPARIAPDAGSYPATFSGSAKVDGSAQHVPSAGSLVFAATGDNLRQSSPGTPGDIQLTQHFVNNKSDLVSLQLKAGSVNKTFAPAGSAVFVRYDAPSGTTWSWTANSTDGKTHVSATVSVGGVRAFNVGSENVSTIQIDTSITISGDIAGTAHITTWVSPTYRLPIVQRQQINAKQAAGYGFSATFTSDITSTLTSLSPN
jgi:hypothetical protein